MSGFERQQILSGNPAGRFFGRSKELDQIFRHAKLEGEEAGLLLLSAPGDGATELLHQTYDQLFYEEGNVIPIYFSLSHQDRSVKEAATRFLHTFLLQVVAFRRKDAGMLGSSPDICEIAEKAAHEDEIWFDRLIANCEIDSELNNERSYIRNCLSAPLRAFSHKVNTFVMIENLHLSERLGGEVSFLDELKDIFSLANFPFLLAGRRRYLLGAIQKGGAASFDHKILKIEQLADSDAKLLIEDLSSKYPVAVNDQTIDLIIQQFRANPLLINTLFQEARDRRKELDSFQKVEQVFADSIFGGKLAKLFDSIFADAIADPSGQLALLGALFDTISSDDKKLSIDKWRKKINLPPSQFQSLINRIHWDELIRATANFIDVSSDSVEAAYIASRFRLEVLNESRAAAIGDFLAESLKKAPQRMAKHYRESSALGLKEILSIFNCQEIAHSLFDYEIFKHKFKGEEDSKIIEGLRNEQQVKLPQAVFTANCSAFYPPIRNVSDDERCAIAIGFEQGNYTEENETAWLAAEIDSKLEASRELIEFWCDRLEIAALMCDFPSYKIWLITPEGFSPEALAVMKERGIYGSSRKQFSLIINALGAEAMLPPRLGSNEYEMVVPMGDDTEMIAAQTIEEIAKRHNFQPKAINQIKTALVEACINASEHSHSPDRKIYQKFTIEDDKIIITISNRGLKMPAEKPSEAAENEGRRGWGLKLMRSLMDEVKLEVVDDGTRISMTKFLEK